LISTFSAAFAAGACSDSTSPPAEPDPAPDTSIITYTYSVTNTFPHQANTFTQGLVYVDSVFVEGTGFYLGPSTLRRVEVETGTVVQIREVPDTRYFGEGVAVWGDTIVQLTWLDSVAIVYDRDTFDEIGRFRYPTEGWGLTHDGARLIMSDGTDTLYFRDPDTFAEIGRVAVTDEFGRVTGLNELEYIDGCVYANRYKTTWIVMIDPDTGRVRGRVNLVGLEHTTRNVTNGIAFDARERRLFVTGKLWQHVYEIVLKE
jgi:glutamine cyclotransferase